jgi:hypothetical protein
LNFIGTWSSGAGFLIDHFFQNFWNDNRKILSFSVVHDKTSSGKISKFFPTIWIPKTKVFSNKSSKTSPRILPENLKENYSNFKKQKLKFIRLLYYNTVLHIKIYGKTLKNGYMS